MNPSMHSVSDATLLDIWEQGHAHAAMVRANLLLGAALPALDQAARAALPLSAADVALLRLRIAVFGSHMPAETICRACAEPLDFELDAAALIDGLNASPADAARQRRDFREPAVGDLEAVAGIADQDEAIRKLVSLCRLDPDASAADDIALIDALYGQSGIRLRLDCVGCGHAWQEDFDIAAYLWQEFERRAQALIDEIHVLATAYGWSEPQILALSGSRRAAYLLRCGA
jgi:hypothetical protein